MGGGEAKEVKEEREGASTTTTTNTSKPKPPKKGKGGKATTGKKRKRFESDLDYESEHPASSSLSPPARTPPPQRQRPSRPEREGGGGEEGGGGGEQAGGGGRRRRKGGGGHMGGNDPLVGTTVHVPYGGGVQVGTVTGVHIRKSGVVWVKYPNKPKLYDVERHLIFGTAIAAEAHLQKVRKGKTPTTNPPPPNEAR